MTTIVLMVGFAVVSQPVPQSTDMARADQLFNAVRSAVADWRENSEFKCTYKLRAGYALSVEAAEHNEIDAALTPDKPWANAFEAKGRIAKKGRRVRHSVDFGDYMRETTVNLPNGKIASAVENSTADESTNGLVVISYHPLATLKKSRFGDNAVVERRSQYQLPLTSAGPATLAVVSPLNPTRSQTGDDFADWKLKKASRIGTTDSVGFEFQSTQNTLEKRLMRVSFKSLPPVIERIFDVHVNKDGTVESKNLIIQSEFQKCPGGMVPGKLIVASQFRDLPAYVHEWTSEDLGKSQPEEQDFSIKIATTTNVIGLVAEARDSRSLNPDDFNQAAKAKVK